MFFFNKIAEEHNLPINCIHHDFRNPLPKEYKEYFDVFVTDPPYTVKGMLRFIQNGIDMLAEHGIGYIAAPFHDKLLWSGELLLEIQKLIIRNECVITEIIKNFHIYQKTDGLTSSMIRLVKGMRDPTLDKNRFYWYRKGKDLKNEPLIMVDEI